MRPLILSMLLIFLCANLMGQKLGERIINNTKNSVENKVERTVDKNLNRSMDKAEEKAEEKVREKKKGKDSSDKSKEKENSPSSEDSSKEKSVSSTGTEKSNKTSPLSSYSKYDFIPGEKVLAIEDFSAEAIGDFPQQWNTNSTAEIVNVNGLEGKWLRINQNGVFYPEFIKKLDENFTLEFDLLYDIPDGEVLDRFRMILAKKDDNNFFTNNYGLSAIQFDFEINSGNNEVFVHSEKGGGVLGNNFDGSIPKKRTGSAPLHVSCWRQKNRLRIYINEKKILDLPRAFESGVSYDRVQFVTEYFDENNFAFISNLRYAEGQPDNRSKLIKDGRMSTVGIQFNSGSEKIKPESYGTLKDLAAILNENPEVRVKIIGHTDADGDEKMNLDLSKKRSEAVKVALSKEFGIDEKRLETDGKGETEPVETNETASGKAANRRVEFIKL